MKLTPGAGQVYKDGAASNGSALALWSNGTASVSTTASSAQWLTVRARGEQCNGAPLVRVTVDGVTLGTIPVASTSWANYVLPGSWASGSRQVQASFVNDHAANGCDRNLALDRIAFSPAGPSQEAESAVVSLDSGRGTADGTASGGAALALWSNGTVDASLAAPAGGQLVVRARGDICGEAPRMRVTLDGKQVLDAHVTSSKWTDVAVPGNWPGGTRRLKISFTNDYRSSNCDRNLRLDTFGVRPAVTAPTPAPAEPVTTAPAPAPAEPVTTAPAEPVTTTPAPADAVAPVPTMAPVSVDTGNPFAGAKGYVNPTHPARALADQRRSWDPAGAAALDKVASGPHANWFGDWVPTTSLAAAVDKQVSTQRAAGALPVLVTYAIPHRDCGQYSAGGLGSPAAYRAWIEQFARGIGSRPVAVVLEPDALALMGCLTTAGRDERSAMLSDAVDILEALPATAVYIDAGGAGWHSATEMAARLQAAGVSRARGFSLNVSNYVDDATNTRYGNELSGRLGGKHFIADTSRNGLGYGSTWCNAPGRGLGVRFTTATGSPWADAFTWIKAPGESDGTCNGGPKAGQWWTDYAIGLAQRASW